LGPEESYFKFCNSDHFVPCSNYCHDSGLPWKKEPAKVSRITTTTVVSITEAAEKATAREIVAVVKREKEGSKETRLIMF